LCACVGLLRAMLAKLTVFGTPKCGFFDVSVSNSARRASI